VTEAGGSDALPANPVPGPELLTPRRVRALLDAYGLAPSKRHGQNFVVDPNTVRKVVRDAGIRAGDQVVEIGPGLGSLTLALREVGARVVAIEIDRGLAETLADIVDSGVEIVHADALQVEYASLVHGRAKLVANLPYNVATPLVLGALQARVFSALHVMVQREVGERWCARSGEDSYGAVSVKIAALADARIVAGVPRTAFHPVPRVDSVTVSLDPRGGAVPAEESTALFALVDAGFRQRRKRLRNSLSADGPAPADVERALRDAGLDPGARAEELDLAAWRRLAARLQH
jgi:16S rRNA (adenine1518-N6/adenine1519-N6)-dimethyltransferase